MSKNWFFILFLSFGLLAFYSCENPIMAKLLAPLAPKKEQKKDDTRISPEHIHEWGEWEVTIPPDCETEGEETRTCVFDPEHIETRPIAALGHEWGEWEQATPPDCETEGEETRVCAFDSEHIETRPIAALGHEWGEWVVTKEPTKDEEGEETRTCAHDPSHIETQPIEREPSGNAGISISFVEITENAPSLSSSAIIRRTAANGQTSYTWTLDNPEQYTSIAWYVGSVMGSGGTFTVSSSNIAYNTIGTHFLTLEVVKNGLLWTTVITFEVRP